MDKKPLIVVSICVVVLLVLGSLSNVVGYQSVKSTAVNDSPLFSVRKTRAINQKDDGIKSNYLGKGSNVDFLKSEIDDIASTINKFLNMVCKMDMPEVDKLITNFMRELSLKKGNLSFDKKTMFLNLKQIQENDFTLTKLNMDFIKRYLPQETEEQPTTLIWEVGCIVKNLILLVFVILVILVSDSLNFISSLVITCIAGFPTCSFTTCPYNSFCLQE